MKYAATVEKKRMVSMQEFRGKRMIGHAFQRCGLKLKSNVSELAKKMQFSGLLLIDP